MCVSCTDAWRVGEAYFVCWICVQLTCVLVHILAPPRLVRNTVFSNANQCWVFPAWGWGRPDLFTHHHIPWWTSVPTSSVSSQRLKAFCQPHGRSQRTQWDVGLREEGPKWLLALFRGVPPASRFVPFYRLK